MTDLREELAGAMGGMERFARGFDQRTFSPDKRAREAIEGAVQAITDAAGEIYEAGLDRFAVTDWTAGYKKRWVAYQHAGARTMNWMITGPARFPVERNRKRMEIEAKRLTELLDYEKGVAAWIRRRRRAAERSEAREADTGGHKETLHGDIRLIENTALDRLQIVFPDKPSDEERALLKSRGFKWAPSVGAWQRQLTNNARHAASFILKQMEAA